MASSLQKHGNADHYLMMLMKEFPHFTCLETTGPTHDRIDGLLEKFEKQSNDEDFCNDETIAKMNFMTWTNLQLGNYKVAEDINSEVISMTNERNVVSLANRVFLSWRAGRDDETLYYVQKLQKLKIEENYPEYFNLAKADLAYSRGKIGGRWNLSEGVKLLEECSHTISLSYFWKLQLGHMYRGLANAKIYATKKPEISTLLKYTSKAEEMFTDVIEHSNDNKLRGTAYSELAELCKYAAYDLSPDDPARICKFERANDLCREALRLADNTMWVVMNCSRILYHLYAIPHLQQFLATRKHTTIYHQLAKCYHKQAKYEAKKQKNDGLLPLSNENFVKSKEAFLIAIQLSDNRNLSAIYGLGFLYKLAGQYHEALESFNQVTNTGSEQNMTLVISSYEEAGFLYMKDCETTLAAYKLTTAINLNRTFMSCSNEPVSSGKIILNYLENTNKECVIKIEILLAIDVSKPEDIEFIRSKLDEYLNQNEHERALAFLKCFSTRPEITSSETWNTETMINLRCQVFLKATANRLKGQSYEARFLFQELFKLHYGQGPQDLSDDTDNQLSTGDILFFYDEDLDTEKGLGETCKTVLALDLIFSQIFGLSTSKNLQGCLKYGPKVSIQLEEMKKYKLVIVVLSEAKRHVLFDEMLALMQIPDPPLPNVVVINTSRERQAIPAVLQQYRYYVLPENLEDLILRSQLAAIDKELNPVCNLIDQCNSKNLPALMKLFCFIINQPSEYAHLLFD